LVIVLRHERRADMRLFRRREYITTHLIGADDEASLKREQLISRAADFWRGGISANKHWCISCKATFSITGEAHPGAFLFAIPPNTPGLASVSGN
jgi:hypothetical protein